MGWRSLLAALSSAQPASPKDFALLLLVPLLAAAWPRRRRRHAGRAMRCPRHSCGLAIPRGSRRRCLAFALAACVQALLFRWQSRVTYALEHEYIARLREQLYRAVFQSRWTFLAHRRAADIAHVLTTDLQRPGIAAYQVMSLAIRRRDGPRLRRRGSLARPRVVTGVAFVAALVPIAVSWRG